MQLTDISGLVTGSEYIIIAAFVASITENIKHTKLPNEYLPFVAAIVGVLGGLLATYITGGTNFAAAAVYGLITGLTTSGVYDAGKTVAVKLTTPKANDAPAETATPAVTDDPQEAARKEANK